MAKKVLTPIETQMRAEMIANAYLSLSEHSNFHVLVETLEALGEDIKVLAIKAIGETEAVTWYQAQYALLDTILRLIREKTNAEEPVTTE